MAVMIRNRQKLVKINLAKLKKDAGYLLERLGLRDTELSILITNDRLMKSLNSMHRGNPTSTDVLSFPLYGSQETIPEGAEVLLGDIVINAHMARRIAGRTGARLHQVVRQLLIHGLLHLIGYDHERGGTGSRKMAEQERILTDALSKMD